MSKNKKFNLLLIESNEDDGKQIIGIINDIVDIDIDVLWAKSLTEGFEAYFSNSYNVMILDLISPEMNGIDTIVTTYDIVPNLPIIALVNEEDRKIGLKSLRFGAQDFLVKGKFNSDQLISSIQYALGRKKVEKKLRRNKNLLFNLFNDTPIILFLVNEKWEIIKVNNSGVALSNIDEKSLVGRRSGDMLRCLNVVDEKSLCGSMPECEQCKINTVVRDTFKIKEPVKNVEMLYYRRSGNKIEARYFLISTSYIEMIEGPLVQISINDITELKASQHKNEQSKQWLKTMLRVSEFRTSDIEGYYSYALRESVYITNSSIGMLYAYDQDTEKYTLLKMLDLSNSQSSAPSNALSPEKNPLWKSVATTMKAQIFNEPIDDDDLEASIKANVDNLLVVPVMENDKIVAMLGVAQKTEGYESTEMQQLKLMVGSIWKQIMQKKSELELIKAKERAEQSDRLKSAFLATMSHELRTPLNAVIGFSELLMDEENKDFVSEFSLSINQSGKHLLGIIEEVFMMTELESVGIELKKDTIEIEKLFMKAQKEAANLIFIYNKTGHITVETVIDDNIRQSLVEGDMARLQQVLKQLISNAVKFTSDGVVQIGAIMKDGEPVLFVKDQGIGIDKKFIPMVLDRFVQVEQSHTREYSGIGLGLTIANRIVNLHNGKLWIESELNKGTTVYVSFPKLTSCIEHPVDEPEMSSEKH